MAEGSSAESKILCRYFVHGACRQGDNCRYSHNRSDKQDNVCKYYLKGCCVFADHCKYDHKKPVSNVKETFTDTRKSNKVRKLLVIKENETDKTSMVSLRKKNVDDTVTLKTPKPPKEWVLAAEFIPGQRYTCSSIPVSYAAAISVDCDTGRQGISDSVVAPSQLLCPFSINKECPYGDACVYMHGELCELCGLAVLEPGNIQQNELHKKECVQQHERDMELSFAIARSKDKQCGICMDIIMDKQPLTEQRFGIMSDCTHCFCLSCIRKWRASTQFDNKTIRSCPECRIQSDFVTPSMYWVDTKDEKIRLIEGYKQVLSKKPCKYFDEGRGECTFNDRCFYQHMLPDGTIPPCQPHRRRRRHNADGELNLEERVILWDFFQERQDRLDSLFQLEMLEDDLAWLIISLNFSSSEDDIDDEFSV